MFYIIKAMQKKGEPFVGSPKIKLFTLSRNLIGVLQLSLLVRL